VIAFDSQEGYEAYIDDPDRVRARVTLNEATIEQRVLAVSDVLP
jgi:hypothetical protein